MVEKNGADSGRSATRQYTQEGRRNISEGLKRRARGKRENMDVSDEWKELLLLRGAHPQTIDELSGSSQDKDEKNQKSIDFARELLAKGLINEDLTAWRVLRNIQVSFFDKLRLEVFYKGLQQALIGNLALMNSYIDTGHLIDNAGFDTSLADEEGYVAGLIDEKPAGIKEDRFGYYREDKDGRWREPVVSGNGVLTVDSPKDSVSRRIRRDLVERGRKLVE